MAGPTASGKSKLAVELAKKINGEIINADSMQVYKEFSILSSRPNINEVKKAKHFLYGFISAKRYFSAGDWLKIAKSKINQCHKNKKIPIIVGGTGLYFNAITRGISKIPNIDQKTRNKVRNLFKRIGYKNFYEKLLNIDPKAKNRILPTDSQRTQRAYEVILKTKKSLFDWIINTKSDFINFEIKKIFLSIPREELLKKISIRKNAITYMINQLRNNEAVTLYDNGSYLRDIMHIKDVSSAIDLICSFAKTNEIYNISSGIPISIKEIITKATETVLILVNYPLRRLKNAYLMH
mgnify:CR=1 FL=1